MNEELLKRVDALAEKLGTTAEYLWGELVSDAIARGIAGGIAFGVMACLCAAVARPMFKKCWALVEKDKAERKGMAWSQRHEDAGAGHFAVGLFASVAAVIFAVIAVVHILDAASPNMAALDALRGR